MYRKRLTGTIPSENAENDTLVDAAITFHTNFMTQHRIQDCVIHLETAHLGDFPLKSLLEYQAIIDRVGSGNHKTLTNCMEQFVDAYERGVMHPGDYSQNRLKKPKDSIIEIFKMQVEVKNILNTTVLTRLNFPKEIVNSIVDVTKACDAWRKNYVAWPSDPKNVDQSKFAAWRVDAPGSLQYMEVMKQLCFSSQYYRTYKTAIRAAKHADDFLEYPSVVELLQSIDQAIEAGSEAKQGAAENAAPIKSTKTQNNDGEDAKTTTTNDSKEKNEYGLDPVTETNRHKHTEDEYARNVRLLAKPKTMGALIQDMKTTGMNDIPVDGKNATCMINWDVALARQCKTRPDIRHANHKQPTYHRTMRAILAGRWKGVEPADEKFTLQPGNFACIGNAGKRGLDAKLRAPFAAHTAAEKTPKKQDDADNDPAVDEEDDDDDGPGEEVINAAEADGSEDVVNLITSELTFVIEETVLTQRRERVK